MIRNTCSLDYQRFTRFTTAAIASLLTALCVSAGAWAQDTAPVTDEPSTPTTDEAPAAEAPPASPKESAPETPAPVAPPAPASSPKKATSPSSTTSFPPEAPAAPPVQPAPKRPATKATRAEPAQPAVAPQSPPPAKRKPAASAEKQDTEPEDTEPSPNKKDSSKSDESSGDLIRLGPMLGVGLPNLLSLGGLLKLTRYLGGGINIGLIPMVKVSYYGQATLLYQEYDVYGRLFPFGGGFFLGAGVGYETVKGTMSDKMDTSSFSTLAPGLSIPNPLVYESSGTVKTLVLTPQIGYLYTTDIGFSLGIDLGAQVPIAPSQVKFQGQPILPSGTPKQLVDQVNAQLRDPINQKVTNTLQTIGRAPLPTINLRVGWLL